VAKLWRSVRIETLLGASFLRATEVEVSLSGLVYEKDGVAVIQFRVIWAAFASSPS
jgi:hypothetical protein